MADIAPKLVELSADKLRALHERLHKSEATPEVLEVHHLAINEMLRRGLEAPADDAWDEFEILVDTMTNANLEALSGSLPAEMIQDVIKETGSSVANVQLFLTTTGYEMRLEEVIKVAPTAVEKAETYTPPKAVRSAARRSLDWISEGKAGSGFTGVGRARANQLASGEQVTMATLKRMKSFFSRHEVDKDAVGFSQGEKGYPSAGRVAWDAWGGDAGFAWAESLVAEDDKKIEKHNQGKHDQKTHGSWADGISEKILAGEHPEVEPENLSAYLMKASKRTDHPDLTELSIKGTLLYGDEGMGVARKDMPQIPGKERARFLSEIESKQGITAEKEKVDPTTLKPVQKEISAARAGAIYEKFREDGEIPKDERILISSDGYVIDGHHTWGAAVAFAFDNRGTELPVYRLSVTAKEAMDVSLKWSKDNGFESKTIDAPTKKSLEWIPLRKHGTHDQKTHGSWANTGEGDYTDDDYNPINKVYSKKYGTDKDGNDRMSEDKIYALENYTKEGALTMNAKLRKGGSLEAYKEEIDALDKIIEEAPVLFGDKNLYRVMSDKVLAKIKEGDIVTDKGFISTSKINLIDDTSTREQLGGIKATKDTVAVILPNESKSGKGFAVDIWADSTDRATVVTDSEQEVLLPRNTPLKFMGYTTAVGNDEKVKVAVFQRMDK